MATSSNGHRKPPRVPVVTPQRVVNKAVDVELEALKKKGLAKLLNQHFTETACRLEQEKQAADAAVRDLAQRKAQTSEFKASGNNELSPIDAMRVQANQWQKETRRKEKETLLLYQRYVQRFGDTGYVEPPNKSWVPTSNPDSAHTSAPALPKRPPQPENMQPSTLVPNMASQIEDTLEEYLKRGAMSMPSMQTVGRDLTFQQLHHKEEVEFRNFYRRQLEQKGIDVKSPGFKITARPDYPGYEIVDPFERPSEDVWQAHIDAAVQAAELAQTNDGAPFPTISEDEADLCSVVSGLTTLHSAMTREMLQDCERSVATFLKEEQETIRQMMQEDDNSPELTETSHSDLHKATAEAESMVQQMEEILAEYQDHHPLPSMQQQQQATSNQSPQPYPTANPNEEWIMYYDEFYQQYYYHEKNSNRTQWEAPDGNTDRLLSESSDLQFREVLPERGVLHVRRRKHRKRKARRRVAAIVAALVVAVWYVLYTHHPPTRTAMEVGWDRVSGRAQARAYQERRERELALWLAQQQQQAEQMQTPKPWACKWVPGANLFWSKCLEGSRPWYNLFQSLTFVAYFPQQKEL